MEYAEGGDIHSVSSL